MTSTVDNIDDISNEIIEGEIIEGEIIEGEIIEENVIENEVIAKGKKTEKNSVANPESKEALEDDDEDESWLATREDHEADDDDEDENDEENEEDDEIEEDEVEEDEPKKRFSDLPDEIADLLRKRLTRARIRRREKIKSLVQGYNLIHITENKVDILIQWLDDDVTVENKSLPLEELSCKIIMNKSNFSKITQGKLNPQIALLSDKVKVEGKVNNAVYLFNLLAP